MLKDWVITQNKLPWIVKMVFSPKIYVICTIGDLRAKGKH